MKKWEEREESRINRLSKASSECSTAARVLAEFSSKQDEAFDTTPASSKADAWLHVAESARTFTC